jgi:hypothetical protein
MTAWTRENTQHWIDQLESRVEDIDYYLNRTVEWCEDNGIYRDDAVFACALMTVIWVSHQRNEPLSKREAMELLGIIGWELVEDEEFELNQKYIDLDIDDLLEEVYRKLFLT